MARAEGPQNSFSECLMDGKETTALHHCGQNLFRWRPTTPLSGCFFLVIMIIGVVGWMEYDSEL